MTHLLTILLTMLALDGQPMCAPDPVVTFVQPQGAMAACQLSTWPEYQCQAEGGRLVIRVWTADVSGAMYEVQLRERVYGTTRSFAAQRVYRNGTLVRSAPLLQNLDGPRMPRVRPASCDLPPVPLTDA